MHFSEKGKKDLFDDASRSETKNIQEELETNEAPLENNLSLYGITALSNDMTSILKKIATIYKNTIDLNNALRKKNDVAKGAITQSDIQSIIKVISHDIVNYIQKVSTITSNIRKSYVQLENKIQIILVSNEMDEKYTLVFNKSFFNKNIRIYIDRYIYEEVNSGIFLIKLTGMEAKTDVFVHNSNNAMLQSLYPELRYLDIISRVSDNIFAVLIVDVSQESFTAILKQIIIKINSSNYKQLVSAAMMGTAKEGTNSLMQKLENNLEKAKNINDDFIFEFE